TVSRHLYRVGFKSNYYVWSSHGESYYDAGESSTGGQFMANDWWACTKVMPRGVRETSEDALVALQDDTHNQVVAQSVMLRIETYVVEDDSDYKSTPVVPPNDEYVSEDELDEACTDSDSESDSSS
ncbi:hypothetical protein HID58_059492, partial [Brassica napus]